MECNECKRFLKCYACEKMLKCMEVKRMINRTECFICDMDCETEHDNPELLKGGEG